MEMGTEPPTARRHTTGQPPSTVVFVANARLPTEKAHGHAIVKLCEAFARLGAEVELWHPRRHQFDPRLRGCSVFDFYGVEPCFAVRTLPNIDVVRLDPWLPERLFRPLFVAHEAAWGAYVARLAAHRRADLHVTRDILCAWWLARAGLPTVLDVHETPKGPRVQVLARLIRLRGLRGIVAVTAGNRDRLISIGIDPALVRVAGNGVDPQAYRGLPNRDACRTRLQLPVDRPIVGYVGRFQTLGQEKGIPQLIRAIAVLKPRMGSAPLLLCVGGPMDRVPGYLALARSVGLDEADVRFVDHVPAREVPSWIASLDVGTAVFERSDSSERFISPLKLFEYMAAGIPVVASDLPTVREALGLYPAALLVPPDDIAALAAALEAALAHPRLREPWPHVPTWEDRARAFLAVGLRAVQTR